MREEIWKDGLRFGLVWMTLQFFFKIFHYKTNDISQFDLNILFYFFAGLFSMSFLLYYVRPHNKLMLSALAGAIACGAGYWIGNQISLFVLSPWIDTETGYLTINNIFINGLPTGIIYLAMGFLFSLSLGLIQWNIFKIKWLLVTGIIGFSSYYFIHIIQIVFINSILKFFTYTGNKLGDIHVVPSFIMLLSSMACSLLFGILSGSLFGLVLRTNNHENLPIS